MTPDLSLAEPSGPKSERMRATSVEAAHLREAISTLRFSTPVGGISLVLSEEDLRRNPNFTNLSVRGVSSNCSNSE